MKKSDFIKLNFRQQDALIIAMHVRNEMEEFHFKYLDDTQMKELNQIIRKAIFNGMIIRDRAVMNFIGKKVKYGNVFKIIYEYLLMEIPDYWEIPTEKEFMKEIKEMAKSVKGEII